jgi:hypothetical protein
VRVFAVGVGLLLASLGGLLFGVHMEALVLATGLVSARDLHEVRAPLAGLVEPGWHEAQVEHAVLGTFPVRLDHRGDGLAAMPGGSYVPVRHYQGQEGEELFSVAPAGVRFHRLQPGDELWPGQVVAVVHKDDAAWQLEQVEGRLRLWESSENHHAERERLRQEREVLRHQLARGVLSAPEGGPWLTLQAPLSPGQAVEPGERMATLVPLDPQTGQPRDLIVHLEVDETHWGDLAPGQVVRVYGATRNHRLEGPVEAVLERVEPWGESRGTGRRYHVVAAIPESAQRLGLGSSCKAEIVVGKKPVYRIILEH